MLLWCLKALRKRRSKSTMPPIHTKPDDFFVDIKPLNNPSFGLYSFNAVGGEQLALTQWPECPAVNREALGSNPRSEITAPVSTVRPPIKEKQRYMGMFGFDSRIAYFQNRYRLFVLSNHRDSGKRAGQLYTHTPTS